MIPGPVMVAPRVLQAMARPMISHRSGEFGIIFDDCRTLLKEFFETKNQIAILTGSGTLGMDAAVGGLIGKDDTLVTVTNGKFGERFTEVGERYGKVVPWPSIGESLSIYPRWKRLWRPGPRPSPWSTMRPQWGWSTPPRR